MPFCAAAVAAGGAAGADKATTLSQLMAARGSLASVDVTLHVEHVERVDALCDQMTGQQAWRLAWSPTAVRWEESAISKEGAPSLNPPATIWVFAAESPGIAFDTGGAAKVGQMASLHPERLVHDYFMMIGHLPPGKLVGYESRNDVVTLLEDPGTTIQSAAEEVAGLECIIAEWRPAGADPSAPPTIRVALAPSLGFAQVLREVRANNGAMAQWTSEEFLPVAEGQTALPRRGTYRLLDETGVVQSSRTIAVACGPDGAPLLALGEPVDTELLLPSGTRVFSVDTEESWTIACASDADPRTESAVHRADSDSRLGAGWLAGQSTGARWLLLCGVLACATLLTVWWRVHRGRRLAAHPVS